ncbi:MAG TPA: hypothetical protein VGM62_03935 [Chthoniobacterales bacterium]|jgi:hypothetical protein
MKTESAKDGSSSLGRKREEMGLLIWDEIITLLPVMPAAVLDAPMVPED